MIPLKDNIRSRSFPAVSVALIIFNVLIFIYELSLNQAHLSVLFYNFGVVPRHVFGFLTGEAGMLPAIVPLFTSMFLHGGFLHLLGNMLYLWIFGDNVEDRLGRGNFILLYMAAGLVGAMAQIWANPVAAEPIIGASGAVAGILGAYFVGYPRAKVLTLVPIFFFFTFIEIPAFVFLLIWFLTQWLSGFLTLGAAGNMVAWWAHIGGFAVGAAVMLIMAPRERNRQRQGV
ncbi:rhomboid family intramembrane serine protease [Phosphitispora sp. TUW77]|uniref:rhomboid family intramembrane serine protease n=1 Tax=Phosphitispora sp. TUW77 TaxID=3152361 RepID=UPI003AB3834E